MNLIVDIGNTRIKHATFSGHTLIQKGICDNEAALLEVLRDQTFDHLLVSSVRKDSADALSQIKSAGKRLQLSSSLPLPITINYDTPQTLGVDRIAAAIWNYDLFPGENCLVIDAGTCINYEFLDAHGVYHGGAISPGVRMRFTAMNQYTARLPLIDPSENPPLVGKSTAGSLQSGVMNGIAAEIKGVISRYESQYNRLRPILCGGDAGFFENTLKPSIFVAPDLVLIGLNRILLHHVTT